MLPWPLRAGIAVLLAATAPLLLAAAPGAGDSPRAWAVPPAAVPSEEVPPQPGTRYGWPTGEAAAVLQPFDPPALVWGAGHRGVDLGAPAGSPVLAAADGTVAFSGVVVDRPVVSVDHLDGIRTTYEPVEPVVSAGQAVTRGQMLGTLVAGHRTDGRDALHWGARTGPTSYVNPLRLVQPAVIRLKPVGAD
ncbi:M23 family metallopeptidase [Actinomyces sp. 2119]|uniref:M23 family metallopeptidase n=1 Tax=Actinomyces sp. 2119 TaxID=2321393 RepID=UPI002175CAE7|nr:M23 family metallopeptidase [Actinomyces sp. 2119]